MSGKVNEALFDLIHAMSKSEKRYFKLAASRHTIGDENNYVTLFDFLDKMEFYDEQIVFEHFQGEAFLNRFSITKKRLYDHILSALDAFHAVSAIEPQLFKMLHAADILYEKSLYDQCRRLLRSAGKLAEKHEKHAVLLLINDKQKRLFETSGYLELNDEELESILTMERRTVDHINEYSYLWTVKSKVFSLLSKKGVARSVDEQISYHQVCSNLLNDYKIENLSTECKFLFHHTLSAYYHATGEPENSLHHLKVNIELLQSSENGNLIQPNRLMSVLTNAIYISDKIGKSRAAMLYLAELKKLASSISSNDDMAIKLFSSISSIELSMLIRKGNFVEAAAQTNEIDNKLSLYGNKIVPVRRAFLAFKIAVAHMGTGNFSAALKWINFILNDSNLDKTEDIISFTQMLDLLVHIEMNHQDLLPYALKSVQRFLKSRNRLYNFEKIFLQFTGKLIKCEDKFSIDELWEELCNQLNTLTNDDVFERIALEYFDFQSWAEAKLKRRPFVEIVKEKYNSSQLRQAV